MDAHKLLRSLIRVGRVSSVNRSRGTVQVLFPDRDNSVSSDLPVLKSSPFPSVNEQVVCIFLANGIEVGFCLGPFYSESDPPGGRST